MSTTPAPADPTMVLHASTEYLACTPKQRLWVDTFIVGQDAMQATQTAYPSAKYSQALSAQLRANYHIRAALNVALGLSEYEMFLDEVKREIQHAPVGSDRRIRALAMYARMKWGDRDEAVKPSTPAKVSADEPQAPAPASIPPADPTASKKFKVGDIVVERDDQGVEHRGRVTAVDTEGQILDAEEFPS